MTGHAISRRGFLAGGAGIGVLALAGGGLELVDHGVLPGKTEFDRLTGGCDVAAGHVRQGPAGRAVSGSFFSAARNTTVGWTISYPPGFSRSAPPPLVLALHGFTGSHAYPLGPITPVRLLAERVDGRRVPPLVIAAADGGNGYWHAHPGDDPMRMLIEEFLPMCRRRGLGHGPIGVTGTSMGGYGALLVAETHPDLVGAVAAISPAVWTSYAEARAANPGAYVDAADFAAHDVVTHTGALRGMPVRVASGDDDPFHRDVLDLAAALPGDAEVVFAPGCHAGPFFASQAPPSLEFLGRHLPTR